MCPEEIFSLHDYGIHVTILLNGYLISRPFGHTYGGKKRSFFLGTFLCHSKT